MQSPDLDAIVATALNRPARLGDTRLLCIDGPAGSGKTTASEAVVGLLADAGRSHGLVHMDDLYEGWEGLDLGVEPRLLAQLIIPMSGGAAGRWQRYDWYAGSFGEWIDQAVVDVLVVEGCGSGAAAYAPYRSLLVWIEADRETRIARGITRDGEQVLPRWLAWMDSEARHFAVNQTRQHADLVYSTS
jgi:uridine kinase